MSLELIIGCMFSGKTTKIKEITNKLQIINANYIVINSIHNNRNNTINTSTHNSESIQSTSTEYINNVPGLYSYDTIILD